MGKGTAEIYNYFLIAIAIAFIFGVLVGLMTAASSNPYAAVITSYLRLHFWHRAEALHLSAVVKQLGFDLTFSSPDEQQALRTTAIGLTTLALGWRSGRNRALTAH